MAGAEGSGKTVLANFILKGLEADNFRCHIIDGITDEDIIEKTVKENDNFSFTVYIFVFQKEAFLIETQIMEQIKHIHLKS